MEDADEAEGWLGGWGSGWGGAGCCASNGLIAHR